jgi:uncharacterized protein (DUF2164 family)
MNRNDIDREKKKQCIEEIKDYFAAERDEIIGDMAAELILGFILDRIAPIIYNQAIEDAHRFLSDKLDDLYGLEK